MSKKLVVVVDTQVDFMLPTGKLHVDGASNIISQLNLYLSSLKPEDYAGVIFTMDTHYSDTYDQTEEAKMFPLHCDEFTPGWQNVINYAIVNPNINTYQLIKNEFDMWSAQDNGLNAIGHSRRTGSLNDYLASLKEDGITTVQVVGVASDFCVKSAIAGFVEKGLNVEVLGIMTKGINEEIKKVVLDNFPAEKVRII